MNNGNEQDSLLAELDALTGLGAVKAFARSLVYYAAAERMRKDPGAKPKEINLNVIFTGNPGTGKTMAVRALAKIMTTLGLLPAGQVVEVGRSALVGEYIGQTTAKTNALIDTAIGGILVIEDIDQLGGNLDLFGQDAINALMKRMEDDRGRLMVIATGYPAKIKAFMDSNPGLPSRFARTIHFDDYSVPELQMIFAEMVRKNGLTLSPEAESAVESCFARIVAKPEILRYNARDARNLFEQVLQRRSQRLVAQKQAGADIGSRAAIIEPEDIPIV